MTALLTGCLAGIDRLRTSAVIRQQLQVTPQGWRHYWQAQTIEQERTSRIERAQSGPFEAVLHKLRGSTSAERLLVVCKGSTDEPVFRELLSQVPDVPEVLFDFVGGWPALAKKDPHTFTRGAKGAIVVMDGDNGRRLSERNCPLTIIAMQQEQRLAAAGVELRVLKRYGIENYFPRAALEAALNRDLASYFPIPPHENIADCLSEDAIGTRYHIRRLAARILGLRSPNPTRPFYAKGRNAEVAQHINLERDLSGTDLYAVIHEIAEHARNMSTD